MWKKKFTPQELRQLAETILRQSWEGEEVFADECNALATTLVRQWITYGVAVFFGDDERYAYLHLGRTPLGRACTVPEEGNPSWMRHVIEDWLIKPDDIETIVVELNLKQSVEVTNTDGVPLRLWVNPKERRMGVEPLVKEPVPATRKRDYRKIAMRHLAEQLNQRIRPPLAEDEMEALVKSVMQQWKLYEGHACLFLDEEKRILLDLTEREDGGCQVSINRQTIPLEPLLSPFGLSAETIPDAIFRINRENAAEFRDKRGVLSVLSYDPKGRKFRARPLTSIAPESRSRSSTILCARCGTVLRPSKEAERQKCPLCGHTDTVG